MIKIRYKNSMLFITCVLAILSCNNISESTIDQKQLIEKQNTQTVNFVAQWFNEGKREDLMREFVREYEFVHQNTLVNMQFPEEIGYDKHSALGAQEFNVTQLTSANPAWDIIMINGDYEGIASYLNDPEWPKKYLVDFSQYPEFINQLAPEIDIEKVKKRWYGIVPGPFLEGQFWALWTNRKVAEKVGIEVKQYGMTFNDFEAYVKAVNKYNSTNSDKIVVFQEAGNWSTFNSLVTQLYLSLFDNKSDIFIEGLTPKKLKAWEQTLLALEQLAGTEVLKPGWENQVWDDIKYDLLNQNCLFFSNGSWMYNIWLQKNADLLMHCMPAEYPVLGKTLVYQAGFTPMWGVPLNSKNKDQAVQFLLEMNQPSMAEKWVRYTKCPTGIKGRLSNITFGSDQFEDFAFHIQETYGQNTFNQTEISEILFGMKYKKEPNYFLDVLQGKYTANEAMNLIKSNPASQNLQMD